MRKGSKVKVIDSPYFSVEAGTVTRVKEIRRDHHKDCHGRGMDLFILAGLPHELFWKHEIRSYMGRKKPVCDHD